VLQEVKTMPDPKLALETPAPDGPGQVSSRKPYAPPKLTRLGSLGDLTRGGDQEQRGEGPGFSL
jgi:hypothetical protein